MGLIQWFKKLFSKPTREVKHFNFDKMDPVDAYEWQPQIKRKNKKD